ncbi:MAG: tetratricopeptide repeat protein [Candidatus Scalindua sp.]
MGNALKDQSQLTEAADCFKKAQEIKPALAVAYFNLGNVYENQGKPADAVSSFKKALEIKPDYVEAYFWLGTSLKGQSKWPEAISCFQKALEINPGLAEAYNNIGSIFQDQGELNTAISYFQRALEIKPGLAVAYYNLGNVLKEQDNLTEAVSSFQKALEINPDYIEAYNNMGTTFKDQGRLDEAISCFQKALKINPNLVEVHNNLGNTFKDQGRLDEANSCFQKALEINPNYAEAYNNMGNMLMDQGNLAEAVYYYQKALKINPNLAEAYYNLGNALKDQNQLTEALSSYQKALEINPDYAEAFSTLFHQLQQTCAWQKLEDMTDKLDYFTTKALDSGTKTAEAPFINISRHTDLSRNYAIAKSWSHDIDRAISTLKIHSSFDNRRSGKTKIIVGYLSNDFRNHAMAHLTLSLYGLHNRDEFKIFCYSYGEDDGSHIRTQIQQDCDKFVDIRNLSHADAARCIYEDQVDILVDLKGYTRDNRLEISALRPAPVQVRYLGLAGTTGADFFDYIITDRIVTPDDHAQYYSENFVYLPYCYQVNSHSQVTLNKDRKKSDFGLPEDSFVFCSFNQGYKIQPVMFNTWMNILRQVPESVLWLQRENEITERNLGREAESKGIKSTRLIFLEKLPIDQHLERLRLADVALDTQIVNGAATTSDALWVGTPVITIQGSSFASRMSSSILTAIGLPELITQTIEEYEQIAVDLGRNPERLQEIRQKIVKNRLVEPLFDTPRFARNLEKAYKEMWEIFIAGETPRQIEVVES